MAEHEEEVVLAEESFTFDPTDADVLELDVADLREQPDITYPAVLLSGVLFTDCLKVLKYFKRKSYREFPTWLELPDGGGFTCIGTMQLDSQVLQLLRHLRIGVTIYFSTENIETLDLNDPAVIEKYI